VEEVVVAVVHRVFSELDHRCEESFALPVFYRVFECNTFFVMGPN
jgi:hypothetical protein